MTDLKSSVFNPGWQQKIGVTEHDVAIPETGERLTAETFAKYRAQPGPRLVLIYTNPDAIVDAVITDPLTMVASDAVLAHPRAAGAFARVLARYVREQRTLTLADAIRKMSLMPAQRLERATAAAARKGRLQVGADADIAIFDLATVADRATYAAPSCRPPASSTCWSTARRSSATASCSTRRRGARSSVNDRRRDRTSRRLTTKGTKTQSTNHK